MRNLSIILTAVLMTLPGLALAEKKIAFVNPMQAISQSEEVQASQMEMQSDMGDERAKLQKLQKEIQQIQQKLQKENMTLSDKEKQNLQDERESKMIEARQLSKLVQKRMRGEQQEIVKKMRPKVMKAVEEIAKDKGYDVVLNIQAVMYARDGMDITKQVVQKLNKSE
jgi:outer membrane protein